MQLKEGSAPEPVEIDDNRPMPALQAMDIDDATAKSAKRQEAWHCLQTLGNSALMGIGMLNCIHTAAAGPCHEASQ